MSLRLSSPSQQLACVLALAACAEPTHELIDAAEATAAASLTEPVLQSVVVPPLVGSAHSTTFVAPGLPPAEIETSDSGAYPQLAADAILDMPVVTPLAPIEVPLWTMLGSDQAPFRSEAERIAQELVDAGSGTSVTATWTVTRC